MPPALFLCKKMMQTILGIKDKVTQSFTPEGKRIPVTQIKTGDCFVAGERTEEKDGYKAIILGIKKKNKKGTSHLREVRFFKTEEAFKVGDAVKVAGLSKGKGFAGVVKRWGFKGGPRTHGQSDRERAPGSIGQTTTPGRVYRGKKMAGRLGGERVTVKNLTINRLDEQEKILEIRGIVPGAKGGILEITKINDKS